MNNISDLDPNFKDPHAATNVIDGLLMREVHETNAKIYGLYRDTWHRAPTEVCSQIGEAISLLNFNTSGARVRFSTNSKRIKVRIHLRDRGFLPHMPLTGTSSVDVFLEKPDGEHYWATLRTEEDAELIFAELPMSGQTEHITIYLPLYNGVKSMELGVEPGSDIEAPKPYSLEKPVVFYGSSITQGGCATRSSNSYTALLGRALNCNILNLGFSGNAKGELVMADYIAGLDMSCFVYDYDHNALTAADLCSTHWLFLERILDKQPNIPIILMSRPNPSDSLEDFKRREVILETSRKLKSMNKQAYFIDGWEMFGVNGRSCCTVDGVHPNDLGFYRMAEMVYPALKHLLACSGNYTNSGHIFSLL